MKKSTVFIGTSLEPVGGIPCVTAHGEQDDHLRLIVLLASYLGSPDNADVATCTSPHAPWKKRRDAFEAVLADAARAAKTDKLAGLVDPDALAIGDVGVEAWNDAAFKRERKETFQILLDAFKHGGWVLVRPEPRIETTIELSDWGCATIPTSGFPSATEEDERLNAAMSRLSPALQALVHGLRKTGKMSAGAWVRLLDAAEPEDRDFLVLETAYDALSMPAVEAAKRISLLRGPRALNGTAGPFGFAAGDTVGPRELSREAVRELEDGGWFQMGTGGGHRRFGMARIVRLFLEERAALTDPEGVVETHHWLGERPTTELDQGLEAHYHAIESGDADLAVKTALHYGADLRRLAHKLSEQERFDKAAELYKLIVDRFDNQDAYAWEYYGYNLARHHDVSGGQIPDPVERAIRDALRRACDLDADNPLYRGRELGFRARRGEKVQPEFDTWMYHFRQQSGGPGVSFFARPVLKALSGPERREYSRKWLNELRRHDRVKDLLK